MQFLWIGPNQLARGDFIIQVTDDQVRLGVHQKCRFRFKSNAIIQSLGMRLEGGAA